jgi:regulator of replication initiation timing
MKGQFSLDRILRAWASSPNAMVAARFLGISRRTLYYRLEKASLMELRDAFTTLQAEAEGQLATFREEAAQSLLATEAHVTDLTRQVDRLSRENEVIARERAALARENEALRRELLQCLKAQIQQQTSNRARADDPYAILHVNRDAPPEVIEAAHRALAKIHHPDVGGSDAAMQRLNLARDIILRRHGRVS